MPRFKAIVDSRPCNCRYCYMGFMAEAHPVKQAQDEGLEVTDLQSTDAVRTKILQALTEKDPIFFSGFGHGNVDVFTDDNEEVVLDLTNAGVMKGRVVRLLSCLTAVQLGPKMIEEGAKAYFGYCVEWTWVQFNQTADPYDEFYGQAYWLSADTDWAVMNTGNTVDAARMGVLDTYQSWIDRWRTEPNRKDDVYAGDVMAWLCWDRDGYRVLGDLNARITDEGPTPPPTQELVEIVSEGYRSQSQIVELEEGGLREIDVIGLHNDIQIGTSYLLFVTDKETAAPLAGARVGMIHDGKEYALGTVDETGNIIITIPEVS